MTIIKKYFMRFNINIHVVQINVHEDKIKWSSVQGNFTMIGSSTLAVQDNCSRHSK
jgi:hypothetical protein